MALVLRDEMSLYWGYRRICRILHPFGPDTSYDSRVVPDHVYDAMPFEVDRDIFDVSLRLRWLYIMFGQTFATSSGLCAIWDYVLPRFTNMYRVCTALIARGIAREPQPVVDGKCSLERLSDILCIQIHSDAAVAEIIAYAQAIVIF